jgi:cystathionine beta-lyase
MVADIARENGIVSVIDNTFASPVNQNPIRLGIDVVVHSATKYLGGHSDICAGAAVSSLKNIERIRDLARHLGGSLDPHTCYLLERSIKTLNLRVERQNRNAADIAEFLEGNPHVDRVFYPGLKNHECHGIAAGQMSGYGGMVSFEIGNPDADSFQKKLKLIKPSMSLGGVESIICAPAATSHRNLSKQEREHAGIKDSLLRLSVGIEDVSDLIDDIGQALG